MTSYVAGRLGSGLVTMFLFVTLLFFLVNAVLPGDFVSSFGPMPAEQSAAMREQLGLDRPLWSQYLDWVGSLLTLDLGTSFMGPHVWDLIVSALPVTLLGLAFVFGSWLGRLNGFRGPSLLSGITTFVAVLFLTAFPPALAFGMEHVVRVSLGYRGQGEFGSLDQAIRLTSQQLMWRTLIVLLVTLVGVWASGWLYRRLTHRQAPRWLLLALVIFSSWLTWRQMGIDHMIVDLAGTMSLIVLGVLLLTFGDVLLVTRAAMDDVLLEDYVLVARAKGMPEAKVRDVHAARPALLPVLSRFTVSIPYFMTGLVILEAVFSGVAAAGSISILERIHGPPGLGTMIFNAVRIQDTPAIVGGLLVVGAVTLLLRIALDVAHAALDPRIRFGR